MKYTIKLFKFLGYLIFAFSLIQVVNALVFLVGAVWCFFSIAFGAKLLGASICSAVVTHILFSACKLAGANHVEKTTFGIDNEITEVKTEIDKLK